MRKVFFSLGIAGLVVIVSPTAWGQSSPGLQLVTRAAEAMGGREKILALKRITVEGYGQIAYQNGGGNITSSPDAPQKWIDVRDYSRVVDLEQGRMRVRQRQLNAFVFAAAQNMKGVVTQQGLDGDVAFTVNANGAATRATAAAARARRIEMLADPVVIVRAALGPKAKLGNVRASGPLQLVDVTIVEGDTVTLAIDAAISLPASVC